MPSNVGMVSNSANLQKILDSAARKIVTRRAIETLREARASANPKGHAVHTLRHEIQGTTHQDISARVGSNDEVVLFEEMGTKPHIIRPRNARVLRFPGTNAYSGNIVHTAVVHHPGTRGSHFLRDSLRKVIR